MEENFLKEYLRFVDGVTSDPSKEKSEFFSRLYELYEKGCNVERLLTAGCGLSAESGEFMEIIKKMLFQGKPYSEENQFHMKRELGDITWYWANACIALGLDPYEVLEENIQKLESRYPGGSFSVRNSEVRAVGDL